MTMNSMAALLAKLFGDYNRRLERLIQPGASWHHPCRLGNRRYTPPRLASHNPASVGPTVSRLGNRRYAPPRLASHNPAPVGPTVSRLGNRRYAPPRLASHNPAS